MVAGSQPIKVSCSNKQTIPAIGLPMVKNVNQGRTNEIKSRIFYFSLPLCREVPVEQMPAWLNVDGKYALTAKPKFDPNTGDFSVQGKPSAIPS